MDKQIFFTDKIGKEDRENTWNYLTLRILFFNEVWSETQRTPDKIQNPGYKEEEEKEKIGPHLQVVFQRSIH